MTPHTARSVGRLGPAVVALVVLLSVAGGAVGGPAVDDGTTDRSLDGVQASGHTGLTFDPSAISYGTVEAGESETATLTVSNTADEPVEIGGYDFSGDREAFRIVEPQALKAAQQFDQPVEAPPGSSRDAVVAFEPDSPGEYEATLTILGPDGQPLTSVTATGTATAGGDIAASPESLTFEGTTVGSTATRTVTVSNAGDGPLSVSSRVTGADSYSVRDGAEFELQPNDSRRVTVAFEPESTASQTALLELRSGDPDQPVLPIALSNANTKTAVSANQRGNDRKVNISVQNAQAGERVEVPVPSTANESDSVNFDSISVTPSTNTNLSLNVTDSEDPLPTTPAFETGDNATGMSYLNVSHSVPNEDIESIQYAFRVRKDRVANLTAAPNESAAANPDAITMYRYNETAGWTEQGAKRVGATDTHYHYVTNGTGFSEWTTAAKRPDISVADATANVSAARVGETVDIQVSLTNNGGADGVFLTELLLNGSVVDDRRVTVPDGGTVGVTFERPFDQPGNYEVQVNDVSVGIIDVTSEGVEERSPTPTESSGGAGTSGGDGGDDTGDGDSSDDSGLSMPVVLGAGAVVLVGLLGGALYVRGGEEAAAESMPAEPGDDDSVIQTEGFGEDGAVGEGEGGDGGPEGGDATDGPADGEGDGPGGDEP